MSAPFIADLAQERQGLRIELPWPDRRLSPNARLHYMARSALVKKARADAAWETLVAADDTIGYWRQALKGDGPIPLAVTFHPPDNRHRDTDNMVASLKGAIDGIADALKVNDRRFRPHYVFASPAKPGRVIVEVGG